MLSWDDIFTNFQNDSICFDGLSNEEIIKYYIVLQMQIHIFNEMDNGNKNIEPSFYGEKDSILCDKEGTFLEVASSAMLAHKYKTILKKIIDNSLTTAEEFSLLFKKYLNEYSLFLNIDLHQI